LVEDERDLAGAVFATASDGVAPGTALRGPDALGGHVRGALLGYGTRQLGRVAA
jgi:hypothetical protein